MKEKIIQKGYKELAKHKINIQNGNLFINKNKICSTGSRSVCDYCKTKCWQRIPLLTTGQLCVCINPDKFNLTKVKKEN